MKHERAQFAKLAAAWKIYFMVGQRADGCLRIFPPLTEYLCQLLLADPRLDSVK
jgi:hypothetical protein